MIWTLTRRSPGRSVSRGEEVIMNKRMQCKDIPTLPILLFLWSWGGAWCNWFDDHEKSVRNAMPPDIDDNLILAKMRMLIRAGIVDGCCCGCRGDFVLTEKGEARIAEHQSQNQDRKK